MKDNRLRKSVGGRHSGVFDRIISPSNLFAAWREFKNGKTNKKDVLAFAEHAEEHLVALHADLVSSRYAHGPYSRFFVHDPKQRPIAKASVRDRVLHHAICRILGPIFDKRFIFDSYASRKAKGTYAANERLREFARKLSRNNTRTVWFLKCDIRKFFDSVDHGILLELCGVRIVEKSTLNLLRMIVSSFETRLGKGIPLGNLTSQLFANIYLDQLDQFVKRELRCKYYIRYTDDFLLLSLRKSELEEILCRIRIFLMERLRVQVHDHKVFITTWHQGIDFLGWIHFPYRRVLRTSTKHRMIRKIIAKNASRDTVQSYLGLLSHGNSHKIRRSILDDILE